MGLIRLAAWLLFLFFSPRSVVWAQNLPAPQNYVSDFAQVIDSQSESDLNQKLSALESQTGVQVAVVTVTGLEDMSVEEYAEKLFQKWGIGKKGEDNGLLLLVSPSDREVRFEVGYGLEPVITDGRAGEIIRNQLIPQFKQNNYQQGIIDAVGQISKFVSTPSPSTPPSLPSLADFVGFLITGGVVSFYLFSFFIPIIVYFTSFLARTKSYYLGGVIGFVLGLIFLRLVGGLIFGLLGLILDYVLSRNYKVFKSTGRRTDFFGSRGGFWSGGGGFKGGGGGFGGFGGGRSGGGGASGKW